MAHPLLDTEGLLRTGAAAECVWQTKVAENSWAVFVILCGHTADSTARVDVDVGACDQFGVIQHDGAGGCSGDFQAIQFDGGAVGAGAGHDRAGSGIARTAGGTQMQVEGFGGGGIEFGDQCGWVHIQTHEFVTGLPRPEQPGTVVRCAGSAGVVVVSS